MPAYDYECMKCGHIFTRESKMSDHRKHPKCPKCKSVRTEQYWGDGRAPDWSFTGPMAVKDE